MARSVWPSMSAAVLSLFLWFGFLLHGYILETHYIAVALILTIFQSIRLWGTRQLYWSPAYWFPITLLFLYFCSLFYAVDAQAASLELCKWVMVVMLLLTLPPARNKFNDIFIRQQSVIGGCFVVVGLVFELERNNRLESSIAYANTFAILLLISIVGALIHFFRKPKAFDWVLICLNAIGLLLTYSRSVWILTVFVLAVMLWFSRKLVFNIKMVSIVAAFLCAYLGAAAYKGTWSFLAERVTSINLQASEFRLRLLYWKDGLKLLDDYFMGAGGGGWARLQYSYQEQVYFVKYVHNGFLQIALDVGWIGFVVFVLWIAYCYRLGLNRLLSNPDYSTVTSVQVCMLIAAIILLHAGFDFDLSFPLVIGMLAICLTYMTTGPQELSVGIYRVVLFQAIYMLAGLLLISCLVFY